MRSGLKMKVWEVEQFLNQTSDVARSLTDPWILDPAQEYDYEGNPTGDTHELPFDPQILLDTIMLKGGELGVLFNNIATYYRMNKVWWDKWKPTFQRWWEVEEMQYNPMWDRDGRRKFHEDIDDDGHSDTTTHDEGSEDNIHGDEWTESGESSRDVDFTTDRENHQYEIGSDKTEVRDGKNDTYSKSKETTTNAVSAYDAGNTLQTHDSQTHSTGVEAADGTHQGDFVKNEYSSTTEVTHPNRDTKSTQQTVNPDHTDDDMTYSKRGDSNGSYNTTTENDGTSNTLTGNERDIDHAYREWGQWGISTISQNMYALQYKVRKQNNPYELMSDIFIKEMTDGVWV